MLAASILKDIVRNMHDEIIVFDNNYTVVFANETCYKHYGLTPEKLIGKTFEDLDEVYWGSSTIPAVYETKKTISKKQITSQGHVILTTSVPIFDKEGNLIYVVQNVNDLSHIEEAIKENEIAVRESLDCDLRLTLKESKSMEDIYMTIDKIKDIKSPCLILGETGTGKSELATYIHNQSKRSDKPLVSLNCSCIHPNLIESELFGYRKGAFSGANTTGKKGIVEIADGGTLFLDEISELPYDIQSKLLLFIQNQEFIPVGGVKKEKVDVKIIAATNRNLETMIENKTFREDLYFRINTFEFTLPPLRERGEDILMFIDYYLRVYNEMYGRDCYFSEEVKEVLREYYWPGNIRELSNILEKTIVLAKNNKILKSDLPVSLFKSEKRKIIKKSEESHIEFKGLDETIEALEKAMIIKAYNEHRTSVGVAKLLKISQPRAYRLIQKYCK